ncbi:MAG: PEP-CTERM sorting domain-containing protein [Phycisphaerae bacterium]
MQSSVSRRSGGLGLGSALLVASLAASASGQVIEKRFGLLDANPGAPSAQRIGFIATLGNDVFVGTAQNANNTAAIYKATSTGATAITGFSTLANNSAFFLSGLDTGGLEARNVGTATIGGVEQFLMASTLGQTVVTLDPNSGNLTNRFAIDTGIRGQTVSPDGVLYYVAGGNIASYDGPTGTTGTLFANADIGANLIDGLTVVGDFLYIGDDSTDTVYRVDLTAPTPASTVEVVLTAADVAAKTGDSTLGFESMILGGDGFIYFYDDRSDSVVKFDPANAVDSFSVIATDAELSAAIGSDLIQGLLWFEDAPHVWTSVQARGAGLYAIVPEPTSLAGLGLAVMGLGRRRR